MKPLCVTIQMKAIKQYFHVVLFIMLYKVVLTFTSVDETLVCDHSNESYRAVLSCNTVCYSISYNMTCGMGFFFPILIFDTLYIKWFVLDIYHIRVIPVPWSCNRDHLILVVAIPLNYCCNTLPRILQNSKVNNVHCKVWPYLGKSYIVSISKWIQLDDKDW